MSNRPSLVPFVFSSEVSKTDEQDDDDEPAAIVVVDFQIALSSNRAGQFLRGDWLYSEQ